MKSEITRYINGLRFPAGKRDILVLARIRNAPAQIMDILSEISNQEYKNMTELWHELSEKIPV